MASHPDLAAEQAYIEHAYDSLDEARRTATRLRSMVEVGKGGTEQARWEREMIEENIAARLDYLNLGDASLVFGRIDQARSEGGDDVLHRPHRGVRQDAGAAGRRLAGPGGRAVLPGHGPGADGPRPSPPLRHPRPQAARHRGRAVRRGRRPPGRRAGGQRRRRPGPRPGLAHRRPRGVAHRPAVRHRRHDPGRAGRDHPVAAARRPRRAGRPGHRQDRRRPPPRRLPALHLPLPARGPGRAGGRAQPAVPRLHRAGAAQSWARPGSSWRCWPTWSTTSASAGATRAPRPGSRATPACPRSWPRPCATASAPLRAPLRVGLRRADARSCRPSARPPSWPTPAAGSASTTPAGASSRRSCSRRWPSVSRLPTTPEEVRERARRHARGPRGARAHVAGPDPGAAPARPVRLAGAHRPGGRPAARRGRAGRAGPPPRRRRRQGRAGPTTTCRCSTRPGRCSARGTGGGGPTAPIPTRSAPTATSSSTRRRTCRPCSSACSNAGR